MPDTIGRIGVLVLLSLLTWAIVWYGRRFVEKRRRLALAAAPFYPLNSGDAGSARTVRILAFSSEDCRQCHQMQTPALLRVTEARKNQVRVEEIDAPSSPELTQRYKVLTLPTTVVLDPDGRVHAVNYGFANTQRLLEQVDALLAPITA
jgi:hypothetical protein